MRSSRFGLKAALVLTLGAGVVALPAAARAADPAPAAADAKGPSAKAHEMAEKGLKFLKGQQKANGSWQGPRDPPGVSALVIRAFIQDPEYGAKADFVKKGLDQLVSIQQADGGIYEGMLANYNTAIAVSTLATANDPAYKEKIDRAVKFLKGIQVGGDEKSVAFGGTGYDAKSRPDLSNTQTLLEALHDAGLKPDDPAFQNAMKFVTRSQNLSETNKDQPWAGEDGGFIYTPVNGGSSNAGEYTGPDGKPRLRSYGLMTYGGLKSMIYAGLTKDDQRVKAAWEWIGKNWTLDEHPGMRAAGADKAKSGIFYFYYTMARSLNVYDEPVITDSKGARHDWRVEFIEKMASLQNPDGSWIGDKSWMENNPVLSTSYVVMALQDAEKDLKEHPPKDAK